MKVEVNFSDIFEAVRLTEHVAGKHMTLPVLSCIVMNMTKNGVVFKSTNLDIGVEVSIPAKSNLVKLVAVPAAPISSFISAIQNQEKSVVFEDVSGNIQISSSKSKGVIKTVPAEDFPNIPRVVGGKEFTIQADYLIKGLRSVWYSASVSSVKPELSSVYIYQQGEFLVFVATDSFRLAEKKIHAPTIKDFPDVLIPFKNISELIRILERCHETVTVQASKNLISFSSKGIYAVSRVIDGVFPDYKQIIPKSSSTEIVVLKQDLVNALKLSNIFSDKFNQVRFIVDPKEKLFEIQTKNSDIGENSTHVDAAITGERMEINFNYKYIIDCFQSIDADSVSLQLGGLNKPLVIRPISGDQTFMYIVMPMNR